MAKNENATHATVKYVVGVINECCCAEFILHKSISASSGLICGRSLEENVHFVHSGFALVDVLCTAVHFKMEHCSSSEEEGFVYFRCATVCG